ncbi:hypothetical protein PoB_002523400 [Plakobranchus ocellatus]|uniref:Uncharacterized protein n=1 Tax=Plakobranchus ocellatus TaxID=259542 RepID=A0AAV3ZTR1_9GAST|nr:hypothetical protein PoB_002523400 [Plakobranchus ocellatus]
MPAAALNLPCTDNQSKPLTSRAAIYNRRTTDDKHDAITNNAQGKATHEDTERTGCVISTVMAINSTGGEAIQGWLLYLGAMVLSEELHIDSHSAPPHPAFSCFI